MPRCADTELNVDTTVFVGMADLGNVIVGVFSAGCCDSLCLGAPCRS